MAEKKLDLGAIVDVAKEAKKGWGVLAAAKSKKMAIVFTNWVLFVGMGWRFSAESGYAALWCYGFAVAPVIVYVLGQSWVDSTQAASLAKVQIEQVKENGSSPENNTGFTPPETRDE